MLALEALGAVKRLEHENRRVEAPYGIGLDVREGEIILLIGPSGCGKSAFLRMVAGPERPDGGRISFGGKPVTGTGPGRIIMAFRPRSSDDSDLLRVQQEIRSELRERV